MQAENSKKYLLVISIHGLIRGHDLELGRDADTGGQTKYVVDLVNALAQLEDVERVDLVTRRVAVSYTHLTLPTTGHECRSRWSPDH